MRPKSAAWRAMVVLAMSTGALPAAQAEEPAAAASAPAAAHAWQLAGRQGIAQYIVVPIEGSKERSTYDRIVDEVCEPGMSCFISFFTNSKGVDIVLPLPDAIDHEPTAVFRRSIKQGGEQFRWSCRLGLPTNDCF